jgi:exonuclease V gamma subunit
MTETTGPGAPEDFDLDAWLDETKRPERSVTVYGRSDLIADMDVLEERIRVLKLAVEQAGDEEELGSTGKRELRELEAQWQDLAEQFSASAFTLRVQGLTKDEQVAINVQAKEDKADDAELGYRLISAALVKPKATPKQARRLKEKLGEGQFGKVVTAYNTASTTFPKVNANFLPKSSGRGSTDE